jgi:putative two-component system response regulator
LEKLYNVHGACSGAELRSFIKKKRPNLILLDLHMPDEDGFTLYEYLQDHDEYRDIPVIFMTSDSKEEEEERALIAGAMDFIKKPFLPGIILRRIERVLELARLQNYLQDEVKKQTKKAEQRREKLERLTYQIMQTLAGTIDAKDKYTNGHSVRVAEYAKEIARRAGMEEAEQEIVYCIGLLHDIGKIGIPDEIIKKTSGLTDEEYKIICSHPAIGAEILQNISEIPNIELGAHWHHERYDGTGYPDGLKGEDIPVYARIIGVADTYDAMASKRSYRDVLPQEVVRKEIAGAKYTQLDPVFADIMLSMIDDDIDYCMREK